MITVQKPIVSPLVESAVAEIRNKGVEPKPDDVIWLHYAAKEITGKDARDLPVVLDLPLEIGGTLLWPMCAGAYVWYQSVALPLFGNDVKVMGFALAYGRDAEGIQKLVGKAQIADAVNVWINGLTCSLEALERAVDRVVMGDSEQCEFESPLENAKRKVKSTDWGETIAILCHNYQGTSPDYWLWDVSLEMMRDQLSHITKFMPNYTGRQADNDEASAQFRAITLEIIRRGKQNGGA